MYRHDDVGLSGRDNISIEPYLPDDVQEGRTYDADQLTVECYSIRLSLQSLTESPMRRKHAERL